nr:MAG TPA: hypothetical protein [Caudoviricetes sp.]
MSGNVIGITDSSFTLGYCANYKYGVETSYHEGNWSLFFMETNDFYMSKYGKNDSSKELYLYKLRTFKEIFIYFCKKARDPKLPSMKIDEIKKNHTRLINRYHCYKFLVTGVRPTPCDGVGLLLCLKNAMRPQISKLFQIHSNHLKGNSCFRG